MIPMKMTKMIISIRGRRWHLRKVPFIVRIEYNTFLHNVSRDEILKDLVALNTMLENANSRVTPLIIAAQKVNVKIVEELLKCGRYESSFDSRQPTAIFQAVHYGRINGIEFIIHYYQSHNATRCVEPNSEKWPKSLLELIDKPNENRTSPLMRAARTGTVTSTKLLLKHGAGYDLQNQFGMTALMFHNMDASKFAVYPSIVTPRLIYKD